MPVVDATIPVCFNGSNRQSALSHWFFLVSEAIGIDVAFQLVEETLRTLDDNSHADEFTQNLLAVAANFFPQGQCNPNYNVLVNAFRIVCLTTENPVDCTEFAFFIGPQRDFCEEEGELCLRIEGNVSFSTNYVWSIPPTWDIVSSNNHGTNICVEFHDYPFYPQYIQICAEGKGLPVAVKRECTNIKIVDCMNDDPTCEDHIDIDNRSFGIDSKNETVQKITNNNFYFNIYQINGKLISTNLKQISNFNSTPFIGQILIIAKVNENGEIVETKKVFIVSSTLLN